MSTAASTIQTIPPLAPPPGGRYQYKQFPDNHSFRLLCLFPPRGDGGIECSLLIAEFPFHQAPIPYEAISYVWGNPNDTVDIICDKKSLSITVSLRDALQRVRLAGYPRFLWADGICINQKDPEEKNRQVTLMSLIYLRAMRVLAWMGHDDGEAERAARLIAKMRGVFEEFFEDKDEDDLFVCDLLDASDQADLEFVVRMLERPLFNRVWIIQELGAARETTFLYGPVEIHRTDLYFFVQCMAGSHDSYELKHHTNYATLYSSLVAFSPLLHKDEQLPDFLDLLLIGQSHEASDPRDHVFALRTHPSAYKGIMMPDYRKKVSQVFTELARAVIQNNKSLRILSAVHHDKSTRDEKFPSWVPALHKATLVNQLGISKSFSYATDSGIAVTEEIVLPVSSDSVLKVRGFVFDTIQAYSPSPPLDEDNEEPPIEPGKVKCFREAITFCQFQGTDEDEKRLEDFSLTMVGGLIDGAPVENSIREHRANFAAYLIGEYDMEQSSAWKLPLARNPKLLDKIRNGAVNGNKDIFARDGSIFWNNRRFLRTSQGYFGLGPQSLVEDDLCCVIFGAKVPFVLRRVERNYVLVGECYIQGIMHGEAVEMWRKGGSEVEEFELH